MRIFIFCLLLSTTSMFSQDINKVVESLNKEEIYNRVSGEPALTNTKNFISNQFKSLGLEELTNGYVDDFEIESGLSFGDNSVSFGVVVPRMGIPMDRIKPSIQNWDFEKDWLPLGFTSDGNITEA